MFGELFLGETLQILGRKRESEVGEGLLGTEQPDPGLPNVCSGFTKAGFGNGPFPISQLQGIKRLFLQFELGKGLQKLRLETADLGRIDEGKDLALVHRIVHAVGVDNVHCFVEKSQPMPKNGSQGNFSAGYCAGLWEMALVATQTPYTLVHSQTWKRVMVRDLPKGKDSSVLRAKQLFPQVPLLLKKDHNKAEALLIAEYGRRTLNNKSTI